VVLTIQAVLEAAVLALLAQIVVAVVWEEQVALV
jgi:hypothetical protein